MELDRAALVKEYIVYMINSTAMPLSKNLIQILKIIQRADHVGDRCLQQQEVMFLVGIF